MDAPPDLAPLLALFDSTDGNYWGRYDLWFSNEPLGTWYGITTNAEGRVTKIDLTGNSLSGPIPAEPSQLEYLEELNLSSNRLSGKIPDSLADLPVLTYLNLASNLLTGPIPSEIGVTQPLADVDLSGNRLSGSIPLNLVSSESLRRISLRYNRLSGGIPREFPIKSNLVFVDFAYNQLTFEIPYEIERLRKLDKLLLNNNKLTEPIPSSIGKLSLLRILDLSSNRLTGVVPKEIALMARLLSLNLGNNHLSGTIPPDLADSPALTDLRIADNRFIGCVSTELRTIDYSDIEYSNVGYCDTPQRPEPFSPPYIEWEIGDSVRPSQELAARLGVERVAKFVEKIGWPAPNGTITVYLGDWETVALSWADEFNGCNLACAMLHWEWGVSDALPGAVFARTQQDGLEEQGRLIAQETMKAIHYGWLVNFGLLDSTWHPSWWTEGLVRLVERLASVEAGDLTYETARSGLSEGALRWYMPLSSLENYEPNCSGYCGAMAIEILASQVGLRSLVNYYSNGAPSARWQQTFEHTFNITVTDFYELYDEHYHNGFPYQEIPVDGTTQWPWHGASVK